MQTTSRYLRYPVDRVSVGVVMLITVVQFCLYLTAASPLWVLPLLYSIRWTHLVEHNHVHLPMFTRPYLNEGFSWVLAFGTGMPVELYHIHHVETHHRFTNNPDGDWTSPFAFEGASFPDKPVNMAWYVVTFFPRAWHRSVKIVWHRKGHRQYKQFWRSMVVLGILCIALGLHSPASFAWFYVAPWVVFTTFGAGVANWYHHVGCDYLTPETSANNNLGLFSRKLGFNIGYHVDHHLHPSMHWSLLAKAFDEKNGERV